MFDLVSAVVGARNEERDDGAEEDDNETEEEGELYLVRYSAFRVVRGDSINDAKCSDFLIPLSSDFTHGSQLSLQIAVLYFVRCVIN